MKKKLYSVFAVIILIVTASSFQTKEGKLDVEFPGTVFVKDSLFFDYQEITNINWKEFMHWQKSEKGEFSLEYKNSIPDTTVWDAQYYYFQNTYFSHPKFNNYPVVGIRYDQAVAFCKWRTERVKDMFEIEKKKHPKMQIPNFRYRLPTKAEWEFVANADYSEKTLKEIEKTIKKDKSKDPKTQDTINPANSLWPNKYGVFGLKTNVSEFIQEKGIAMGGNFTLGYEKALLEQKITSVQIEKWLGFRCVCEILK